MAILYLDQTAYEACDINATISRTTSQIPGQTNLSVGLELPIGTVLPKNVRIISCKLSEDTANRIDFATAFYIGASAKPTNNNQSFFWTFKIVDALHFLANSKPIINYKATTTVLAHAKALAVLAERTNVGNVGYRYLDIAASPDSAPVLLDLTNDTYTLATAFEALNRASGYEFAVQEVGWANPEALFDTPGAAIVRLLFRPVGSNSNPAPISTVTWDPTDPDFCGFPFTDFSFAFETQTFTTVRFIGKNGTKAKEINETLQTSYSKRLVFLIKKPDTVAGVDTFDYTLLLPDDINQLNQVLIVPELMQLEVVEPYDPQGTLSAGQCYFDRTSNPPKIIFRPEDIDGLTQDNTCYSLVNYKFIQVEETDSGEQSQLSSGTHGAITKSYEILKDENVADFPLATEAALVRLDQITQLKFSASGTRRTTTENWLNDQTVTFNIPCQNLTNILTKVTNSTGNVSRGKIFDVGEHRDEIVYNLTFNSVDDLVSVVKQGLSLSPAPGNPTYVDVPFDGGVACTINTVISGSNFTQLNTLFDTQFHLPVISTDPVSLVYTANISNIKQSSNISFYFFDDLDTTLGNLTITFNGDEIYNEDLDGLLLDIVNIISLAAYEGQSGELVATLTLPAQPSTTTEYNGFIQADCCAIDTIAGTGTAGFNGDNLDRLATQFNDVAKTRKDSNGNLYVADNLNFRLRKIDTSGVVTTIGGNGNAAITPPTDGGLAVNQDFGQINDFVIIGTNIYLLLPDWDYVAKIDLLTGNYHLIDDDFGGSFGLTSIAKDSLGNIYYSKFNNAIVYKLESETTRTIYAGIFNSAGFSGDGGLATSAQLKFPAGLACDSEDNLYIGSTDASGNRYLIRKVTRTTGIIETICGNGSFTAFDIDAADFQTNDDHNPSIAVDINTGDVYFTTEGIILKINNSDNKINRFCGVGDASGSGFDGDTGAPLTAVLDLFGAFFGGIDVVSATEIYIADEANNRVRQIYCGESPNP